MSLLAHWGIPRPVVVAPMAGGPSRPELVVAAARAGALGFLAAGYLSVSDMLEQVRFTRSETAVHGGLHAFGVNLFVPESDLVDAEEYRQYRERLLPLAARYGVELPEEPRRDDDSWPDKVAALVRDPVPLVSFTFAPPPVEAVRALQAVDTVVVRTVTSPEEAASATAQGYDGLVVQCSAAGGHSGTWAPTRDRTRTGTALPDLLAGVREVTTLPIWAAGGISRGEQVEEALQCGAEAVQVGTAVLRTPEAGTSAAVRRAMVEFAGRTTVVTRGYSGRPARGIRNAFTEAFSDVAPLCFPALHHLTSPLRRAAARAGDIETTNLWAGTGFAEAVEAPLAKVLEALTPPHHPTT